MAGPTACCKFMAWEAASAMPGTQGGLGMGLQHTVRMKRGGPDHLVCNEHMLLNVNRGCAAAGLPLPHTDINEPPA
eukprot:jgi/Chrzof1/94/Cz01g03090.t1